MPWYYAAGDKQQGPITDAEFEQLVGAGTITAETLVWREGMGDWQPYGRVAVAGGVAPGAAQPEVACAECGRIFPLDQTIRLGQGNVCPDCKGLVLQKMREGIGQNATSVAIRQEHIKHEASIRSIGILYYLSAVLFLFGGLAGVGAGEIQGAIMGIFFIVISAGFIAMGIALRKLLPWSRIVGIILACLGLFVVGLGTLISIYVLYLLLSRKGVTVFSKDYKRVIQETPEIKYKTSIGAWIALVIVILLIVFAVVLGINSR